MGPTDWSMTVEELAALAGPAQAEGAAGARFGGIAGLADAGPNDLSFLANVKYRKLVPETRAGVVLVPQDFPGEPRPGQAWLRVANPNLALARLCAWLERRLFPLPPPGVHPTAVVDPAAKVDPSATVGPLCVVQAESSVGPGAILEAQVFVGHHSVIGAGCHLFPFVSVYAHCTLGARVRIHSGTVVGGDGFGFEFAGGKHEKIPQIGRVIIEDDVEIGTNTAVDRARFGETRIGQGSKLDNFIQVSHNVRIGRHCLIAGQSGVSGSSTLEDYVTMAGQSGVAGHLRVGRGALITGQSGVTSDVEPGAKVRGNPAFNLNDSLRVDAYTRRLPDLFQRVATLENALRAHTTRS